MSPSGNLWTINLRTGNDKKNLEYEVIFNYIGKLSFKFERIYLKIYDCGTFFWRARLASKSYGKIYSVLVRSVNLPLLLNHTWLSNFKFQGGLFFIFIFGRKGVVFSCNQF